jgi:putative restriction endonuclease
MNVLERALIEKTEHENSWENVLESRDELVRLASARHRARVGIMPAEGANWRVELPGGRPIRELARSLQVQPDGDGRCAVFGMDGLTGEKVSDRSYRYAVALPRSGLKQLRTLLSEACGVFAQKSIYLSVAGKVEFIEARGNESG